MMELPHAIDAYKAVLAGAKNRMVLKP